jgi:hypothetical protein
MNVLDFVKLANKQRLADKNSWVTLCENVNGMVVEYKAFGTWVQVMRYNGISDSSGMDMNVGEFKAYLTNFFEGV